MDRAPLEPLAEAGADLTLFCLLLLHIGSPNVFHEGKAGPYSLFVTVRPPTVIPGVAEIEIRAANPGVERIRLTPMPLAGEAAKFAPTPDLAARSKTDPQFFTGAVWLMVSGSFQIRVQAEGTQGPGELSVPLPAVARGTRKMDFALGALLSVLLLILAAGAVSIISAATNGSRKATLVAAVIVAAVIVFGNWWWGVEASNYDRYIYKPLELAATVESSNQLVLRLRDPGWIRSRKLDDLIPDHTHLMHLFAVRLPDLDRIWHLHPEKREQAEFVQNLPDMPAGKYQLYADIVHENGFPETAAVEIDLPSVKGKPLEGDDSAGPTANHGMTFSPDLRLVAEPKDLELYMGMPAHAVILKKDRTVFAHIHPTGSVPMAALMLTGGPHTMPSTPIPVVNFPYRFPTPGDYRVFAQIKRAGRVETGLFDLRIR